VAEDYCTRHCLLFGAIFAVTAAGKLPAEEEDL